MSSKRRYNRWWTLTAAMAVGCGGAATTPKMSERPRAKASRSEQNPHERLAKSTVMLLVLRQGFAGTQIRSAEGSGSGFVVEVDGKLAIATAAHVVDEAIEIEALHRSGFRSRVTGLLGLDREADVALLEVDELPAEAVAVPLSDVKPKLADEVVLISSPLGLDTTVSFGTVAAFRSRAKAFQLAAGVSPGSSGGLVADGDGRVLGVIRAKAPARVGGENIAWVTPSRYLARLLEQPQRRPLAKAPDPGRLVTIAERKVKTASGSPFVVRSAAAAFDFVAGDGAVEHYCASASDRDATVALGEADRRIGEAYWRVGQGRSCGSFAAEQPIRVWIGNDRTGATIHVTLQHQS